MKSISPDTPLHFLSRTFRNWIGEYSIAEYTILFLAHFTAVGIAVLLVLA